MNPFVSIIVPCYNQAEYLDECLHSLLEQNYKDWECIIVNDGSTDNTSEIAKKWTDKDSRFNYIKKKNGGLSSARNSGIEIANGKIILPLDADDKIAPLYLQLAIEKFKEDNALKIVYCKCEKFGSEKGPLVIEDYSTIGLAKRNLIFCSAFFKKEDWVRVNGFDPQMIYGLEDWEFWINIIKDGGKVFRLDYVGFQYRIKANSMLVQLKGPKLLEMYRYISLKHPSFFITNLGSFTEMYNERQSFEKKIQKQLKSRRFLMKALINSIFRS